MTNADDELEQYSDLSRAKLRRSADQFIAALEQHTSELLEMRRGTSHTVGIFRLHDHLRRAAAAWDDAVFDHTGTFPLAIETDDEDDEDGEEDIESPVNVRQAVSVVSRWDLEVYDVAELVAAGRGAHRRSQPDETEEDARVRIGDGGLGQALYALAHDFGEPWFDVPGLEIWGAHRVYVARSDQQPEPDEAADDPGGDSLPLVVPEGDLLFRETW